MSLLNLLQYCFCLCFAFFGQEACGILNQWSNSHPLQLKHWVLMTEPPRTSLDAFFKKHKVYYLAFVIEQWILEQFPGQYIKIFYPWYNMCHPSWNSLLWMDSQSIFNALLHMFFLKILNDYLCIFGCTGSSLLSAGLVRLWRPAVTS